MYMADKDLSLNDVIVLTENGNRTKTELKERLDNADKEELVRHILDNVDVDEEDDRTETVY